MMFTNYHSRGTSLSCHTRHAQTAPAGSPTLNALLRCHKQPQEQLNRCSERMKLFSWGNMRDLLAAMAATLLAAIRGGGTRKPTYEVT